MAKRLLIVEEALRDLKAHWFEYIKTIRNSAIKSGWEVDVASNVNAAPEIVKEFSALPVFEHSRYLDNNKSKLPGERHYGFILHSMRTQKVLKALFKAQKPYDDVFVPTVLVHHLLAWYYIMSFDSNRAKHVTLFFVTNPGVWDASKNKAFFPKSTVILKYLLKLFDGLVKAGKVTFAVETKGAKAEFETLSGLPFKLLPHPVPFEQDAVTPAAEQGPVAKPVVNFACYGFARHEKGSDLFKQAIEEILKRYPDFNGHFHIQWTDAFKMPDSSDCTPGNVLLTHPKVTVINRAVMSEEYNKLLTETDCMVLPYRNSSYHARVSRVAIEAAANAIPMIYTKGGWLEETVSGYGAGIGIDDESVESLINAILEMQTKFSSYQATAKTAMLQARAYYSPQHFVSLLLN
ncbi:glycosyltransferase [Mucilaginibacter sp. CSA2-8R]|uniref:glycosyltransferase n=1 Tax=Mucilaginibacter sp. CSA2-8R TaxID=3141542 RepID=UPI00315D5106